jgi:hypothetical protein
VAEALAAAAGRRAGGFSNGFALVHDRLLLGDAVPVALHFRAFTLQKALTSLAFAASFIAASAMISVAGARATALVVRPVGSGAVPRPRPHALEPNPAALSLVGCEA